MALGAVLCFLHVKGLFAIVALAAKSTLGQLAHIHFIGTLRHLENLIVATRAFQPLALHMDIVTEYDRSCPFGPERKIAPPNHLGPHVKSQHHAEHKTDSEYLFHHPPLSEKRFEHPRLQSNITELNLNGKLICREH